MKSFKIILLIFLGVINASLIYGSDEDAYLKAARAMERGETGVVEKLMERKHFNPNFQYKLKRKFLFEPEPEVETLLIKAARFGHKEVVKKLIEKGADVNQYGGIYTPLITAASNGYDEIVGLLLDAGAYVNAEKEAGTRAFELAFLYKERNWRNCLLRLIEVEGFDYDFQDKKGNTPLIHAATYGDAEIVRRLLEKGADATIRNNEGKTAFMVAYEQYWVFNEEVQWLLIGAGGAEGSNFRYNERWTLVLLLLMGAQNIWGLQINLDLGEFLQGLRAEFGV